MQNRHARGGLGLTAAAAAWLSCLSGMPAPAAASPYREYAPYWEFGDVLGPPQHRLRRRGGGVRTTEPAMPEPPRQIAGPLILAVSIASQRVTVYDNGTPIATSPISTGMAGHSTPMGVFSVIQKQRWHHSNLYSNAPMPYMQRITWSGVALHAGVLPGYPASHGCIRLPEKFAVRLWGMTKVGARVVVARNDVVPYDIDHPRLAGLFKTPEKTPESVPQARPLDATPNADGSEITTGAVNMASTVHAPSSAPLHDGSAPDPASAKDALRSPLRVERVVSMDRPADLRPAIEPSAPEPPVSTPHAKPATSPSSSPVSLFVSRKEGKLFVRRGFAPVFEAPIAITQREVPLGTHIFTASRPADGSAGLRWLAVSIGFGRAADPAHAIRKSRAVRDERPVPPSEESLHQAAAAALDRVELPPEVLDRIMPLMGPGASLLISDQGLGEETGRDTDFIVVTR